VASSPMHVIESKKVQLNILLVITGLKIGGAEGMVCDLADHFSSNKHKVMIISLSGEAMRLPKMTNISLLQLNLSKNLLSLFKGMNAMRTAIIAFSPDVVHSHMVHANIMSRLLRLVAPIPKLVCSAHSNIEGGLLTTSAYRITDCLADLTTNVSKAAVDGYVSKGLVSKRRAVVMYNGIHIEKFRFNSGVRFEKRSEIGVGESEKLLIAVGRLVKEKDYPNLLRAFSILRYSDKDYRLAIVGYGPLQQSLIECCDNLSISPFVHFLGHRDDVAEWYSAADLFVHSPIVEGFGLVVAEAMACERPIVSTDCGGVKEVLSEFGFLVPIGDSKKLASAILEAVDENEELKVTKGRNARKYIVENYSLPVIAEKWLSLYQSL